MSEQEPTRPYVYQPFGSVSHPEKNKCGRLYGVSGVSLHTTITGLTKYEAEAVLDVLTDGIYLRERCYVCGHRLRFAASDCPQCNVAFDGRASPRKWPEKCKCERCVEARKGVARDDG